MVANTDATQPEKTDLVETLQRLAAHFDQLAVLACTHTDQLREQEGADWLAAHSQGKQDAYREAVHLTRLMIPDDHTRPA